MYTFDLSKVLALRRLLSINCCTYRVILLMYCLSAASESARNMCLYTCMYRNFSEFCLLHGGYYVCASVCFLVARITDA